MALRALQGPAGGTAPVGTLGGTTNTIPRWTGPTTLGDSGLIDDSTSIYTTTRNVGIGTASPVARMDVSGVPTPSTPIARFGGNNGGGTIQNLSNLAIYANLSGGSAETTLVYGNTVNSYLAIGHHNGTSYAERWRINSSGNVGIGTASPLASMDVSGVSTVNTPIARFTGNNGGGTIQNLANLSIYGNLSGGSAETTLVYGNTVNSYLAIGHHNGTSYTERWRINSSGNLLAGADNTYDIGASGATRPRTVYVGTGVVGGYIRAGAASAGVASTTTIGNGTSTTATAGAETLPANPLGFIIAHVGTTEVRIPYYAV